MQEVLTLLLLFFLPFIVFPIGISPYETPKVFLFEIGSVCMVVCFLLSNKSPIKLGKTRLYLLVGIFFLTCIDLLFYTTPSTFYGNIYRLQGVFLLWCLIAFSLFLDNKKIASVPPRFFFFLTILLFLTGLFIFPSSGRLIGTLGEPNSFAGEVLFFWPLWLMSQKKDWSLTIISVLCGLSLVISAIYLSGSRSGMIGLCIQVLFLFLIRQKISFRIATGICLLLLIASQILPFFDQTTQYEKRSAIWQIAFLSGIESPLLGRGFGNMQIVFSQTSWKLQSPLRKDVLDSSHNVFLDWFVEGGIVGLGLFVSLMFSTILGLIHEKQKSYIASFLGVIACLLFNPVSITLLAALWFFIGFTAEKQENTS